MKETIVLTYPIRSAGSTNYPVLIKLRCRVKDSSVCSLISTPELMLRAKDLASEYFLPMHVYILIGVIYFALAFPLSILAKMVQKRMSSGRRVTE